MASELNLPRYLASSAWRLLRASPCSCSYSHGAALALTRCRCVCAGLSGAERTVRTCVRDSVIAAERGWRIYSELGVDLGFLIDYPRCGLGTGPGVATPRESSLKPESPPHDPLTRAEAAGGSIPGTASQVLPIFLIRRSVQVPGGGEGEGQFGSLYSTCCCQ